MLESLASVLTGNVHLKELHLCKAMNTMPATSDGWRNFATILHNPKSALKELVLTGNAINDNIITAFASALTKNNQLREFLIGGIREGLCVLGQITSVGYAAFSRMLCDTSTILNTYNSNHTLEYTGLKHTDICSLLSINKGNSIRQAARIKIIRSHFSGSIINTQVFTEMKLSVLPTAIAWMCRNNGSHGGRNLMYEFLRKEPLVCDMKRMSKKRKAVD
jgi:hypothetical protein